jgi:hypothetical protein
MGCGSITSKHEQGHLSRDSWEFESAFLVGTNSIRKMHARIVILAINVAVGGVNT